MKKILLIIGILFILSSCYTTKIITYDDAYPKTEDTVYVYDNYADEKEDVNVNINVYSTSYASRIRYFHYDYVIIDYSNYWYYTNYYQPYYYYYYSYHNPY